MSDLPPLDRWSITAELCPLAGGHRARVFRTRGLPDALVFKSTHLGEASLGWLTLVHEAARAAGFRVPHFVPGNDGAVLQDGWTCEAFLPGAPFDEDDLPKIAPQVARFHEAAKGLPQRPGALSSRDLFDRSTGDNVDISNMPEALARNIRKALRAASGRDTAIVHGDLTAANLIRGKDGTVGLIDWTEARRDQSFFDFQLLRPITHTERRATLAWEIACCWTPEPERARTLARQF